MRMSDLITREIIRMLNESGENTAEIQRNEFAGVIGCAPSQINYVLSSRFTPEHGYIIESRRGGGGYIRIKRVVLNSSSAFMHIINSIGESVSEQSARAIIINLNHSDIVSADKAKPIIAAMNENCYKSVPAEFRGKIRAAILKQMLLACR